MCPQSLVSTTYWRVCSSLNVGRDLSHYRIDCLTGCLDLLCLMRGHQEGNRLLLSVVDIFPARPKWGRKNARDGVGHTLENIAECFLKAPNLDTEQPTDSLMFGSMIKRQRYNDVPESSEAPASEFHGSRVFIGASNAEHEKHRFLYRLPFYILRMMRVVSQTPKRPLLGGTVTLFGSLLEALMRLSWVAHGTLMSNHGCLMGRSWLSSWVDGTVERRGFPVASPSRAFTKYNVTAHEGRNRMTSVFVSDFDGYNITKHCAVGESKGTITHTIVAQDWVPEARAGCACEKLIAEVTINAIADKCLTDTQRHLSRLDLGIVNCCVNAISIVEQ